MKNKDYQLELYDKEDNMTTLEMAKEAFASRGSVDAWFKDALPNFEAFEKMVRDDEREACAELCDRFAARDMRPAECAAAIRSQHD